MNGFCRCTSAPIQPAEFKHVFENGAVSSSLPRNNKENKMLKKFAVALVATALIARAGFCAIKWNFRRDANRSGGANRSGRADGFYSGGQADRQDNEVGQALGKACPPSRLAKQKERRVASGAVMPSRPRRVRPVRRNPTSSRNRARLPAIRNMHPTMVRTEARIVSTGLRMRDGESRPVRKPDFSRPAAHKNEKAQDQGGRPTRRPPISFEFTSSSATRSARARSRSRS